MKKEKHKKNIKACIFIYVFISKSDMFLWFPDNEWKIRWCWFKTRNLRKNNLSYTVKTIKHVTTSFALVVFYSEDVLTKK